MAEHGGHDRERSGRGDEGRGKKSGSWDHHSDHRTGKLSSHTSSGSSHGASEPHNSNGSSKRSARNWKNIATHVQVVERMKKTSISNRENKDRPSDGDSDGNRGSREKPRLKSQSSSIRFSDESDHVQKQSRSRSHTDYGHSRNHEPANVYDGYYQQPTMAVNSSKNSLSNALDQIMMDMSSNSTIVECYCGQNSCPQCNLLLKMAGSDG